MKKLMLAAAIVCVAAMSQAAATNWNFTFTNLIGSDNVTGTLGSGKVQLYALIESVETAVGPAFDFTNGRITATKSEIKGSELFEVGKTYDFWFVATDGDATYTSGTMPGITALNSDKTQTIGFSSQAGGKWSSAAPEPTSGLLLLLGVAGLALKRRRV